MKIVITGGAGFVGSSMAKLYRERYPHARIVAFDNLRRRGSELNLPAFRELDIEFTHGDVRSRSDLWELEGSFDLMIDASAEPSVHAGASGPPDYLIETNLGGTLHCLEFARRRVGALVFLSTSRVYSLEPLRSISLEEKETRFEIAERQELPGVTTAGIDEGFPVLSPRTLYGASKLASELFIQEYAHSYGLDAVINRCGVIAGPGQFGKVDQGVFTLWAASHHFGQPLRYTGFGGLGKQVRDLLHPADLFELIERQVMEIGSVRGQVFNVGGGPEISTSLLELTALCRDTFGREVEIGSVPDTAPVDVPLYVSNTARAREAFGWTPRRDVSDIVRDIRDWLTRNEMAVRPIFCRTLP